MVPPTDRVRALSEAFTEVRAFTEHLSAPLGPEDQSIQSMPDVSPTKWHRAHITWFFETFVLSHDPTYEPHHPDYNFLFNSYYEAVGERHPRADRGMLSRPTADEVGAYRRAVDSAVLGYLATLDDSDAAILDLVELGLHHEQQHQELLLMDIKHVLSVNPMFPVYTATVPPPASDPAPLTWSEFGGGIVCVGHRGDGFHFDNEGPAHEVLIRPFALANRLVTAGEWIEFIDAGGYDDPSLWLSEGWFTVNKHRWDAPSYWHDVEGQWHTFTLGGLRPVVPSEPVVHVSHFEADAFARWAGARLPLEAEWEHASDGLDIAGTFADHPGLHPQPARRGDGLQQMFGDVWEWTASPYVAYPGFAPTTGAVGEYNGKFMSNQIVLRGGCCATPVGHTRPTYRNFFPSHSRWMFAGLRLAKDLT